MNAAIYARVSTKKPEQDASLEGQLRECSEYCQRKGWSVQHYQDRFCGAEMERRPGFRAMMEAIRLGKIQVVVAWKLDRLSRSVKDFIDTALILDREGVRLILLSQGIDTDKSNPMSKAMVGMMAVFAEFEHNMMSERVKEGMRRAIEKGRPVGRKRLVVDRVQVWEMHKSGKGIRQIAKELGRTRQTIFRRLKEAEKMNLRGESSALL